MYYTGIGSRETPAKILEIMFKCARWFSQNNYILRSGKAAGADCAFQLGVQSVNGKAEIFIPWHRFSGDCRLSDKYDNIQGSNKEAEKIAMTIHPAWNRCSQGAKKLHTRNICQILGSDLKTPSLFVLYYANEVNGKPQGGTATAVNLAKSYNIPTINMLHNNWKQEIRSIVLP